MTVCHAIAAGACVLLYTWWKRAVLAFGINSKLKREEGVLHFTKWKCLMLSFESQVVFLGMLPILLKNKWWQSK